MAGKAVHGGQREATSLATGARWPRGQGLLRAQGYTKGHTRRWHNWIGERFGIFEIGAASVKDGARSESEIQGKRKHGERRSQSSRCREESAKKRVQYTLELGWLRARADSRGREKFQKEGLRLWVLIGDATGRPGRRWRRDTCFRKRKRLEIFWKKRIRNESKRVNAVGSDAE